jgi:hypothetical protein
VRLGALSLVVFALIASACSGESREERAYHDTLTRFAGGGYIGPTATPTSSGPRYEGALGITFGDGSWLVGIEISPGTYQAPGGEGCYWERLKGFGGTVDDIIANHFGGGRQVVTIGISDKGFKTSGCGRWSKT